MNDVSRPLARGRFLRPALLGIAVFLVVMASFFQHYDPYDVSGPDRLASSGSLDRPPAPPWVLLGAGAHWDAHEGYGGSGGVRLDTGPAGGCALEYAFPAPPEGTLLRVTGRLRSGALVPGQQSWSMGRLLLFFSDAGGNAHWEFAHEAARMVGTHDWRTVSRVFTVPRGVASAHLFVQNQGSAGSLWVDDLRLEPVVQRSTAGAVGTFGGAWFVALLVGAGLVRLWRRPLGVPIALVAITIIVGVMAPERRIDRVANEAVQIAAETTTAPTPTVSTPATPAKEIAAPPPSAPSATPAKPAPARLTQEQLNALKKSAHVGLFAVLGALATWSAVATARRTGRAQPAWPTLVDIAAGVLLFAAGTEVLQYLSPSRTPLVADFGFDALGSMVGGLIAWTIARAQRSATRT